MIGIIGRLVPVKNHKMFIDCIAQLKNEIKDVKFKAMVIGDGDEKDFLIKAANDLGLKVGLNSNEYEDSDVIFTSWILEIENALAGLDIVALTSLNEGTPVSLIEAQAAGKTNCLNKCWWNQ